MRPNKDCTGCTLCHSRQNVVYPDGDPDSPVAFVGEAPGRKEDEIGKPFQGASGKVLDKLLEEEEVPRSSIFITNTVKCRPPQNRDPTEDEMAACLPCLEEELKDRRLIVTLGRTAARDLLHRQVHLAKDANMITKVTIRGKEIDLVVAYHPAASFYNPKVKESLRETIRITRAYLEGHGNVSSTGI
ncbi:MAG: uracil-DNA glycosylase [Euryarchaeota archaeon]|nr:uracil-DNA glycosylase [Euryarchaeota archaeon]